MKKNRPMKRSLIRGLFLFLPLLILGQELPPIQLFSPSDYNAADQNWDIDQGPDETIYIANNQGLLEYNGSRWKLNAIPSQTIVRSVRCIGEEVFTGSYMDFGYWTRDPFGQLTYTSLVAEFGVEVQEDEEFWDIVYVEDWVLFQSLDRIYALNLKTRQYEVIVSDTRINDLYVIDKTVYFQQSSKGIYQILNGESVLVLDDPRVVENEVVGMYDDEGEALLILTREAGFFRYENEVLSPWRIPAQERMQNLSVYSSIRLQNGNYILGTISNGVINLNSRGDLLFSVDKRYGLSNNTVLSVFEDRAGNIWLGLDNGINCINLRSPFRLYRDIQGTLGTVYATARTDAYMYLGTNQGLFYKSWDEDATFKLMPGTMGQVWALRNINGTLFCGHDKGTFLIKDDEATQISSEKGTWELKQLPDRPNIILQGNYKGLSLLGQNRDGRWTYLRKLKGFEMSSRYFEFVAPSEILVSHEHKGVFRLRLDKELTHIESFLQLPIEKGIGSSVFKYRDTIYYAYKKGVHKFNKAQNNFTRDTVLSQFINPETYVSGKCISDTASNRLWAFNENQIIYLKPAIVSGIQELNTVPIPEELRDSKLGYETILALNESSFLVGTTQGYIVIDLKQLDQKDYSIHLDRIVNYARSEDRKPVELFENGSFSAEHNNFEMEFSIADFNALYSKSFQYRLDGLEDNWSEWSRTSKLIFENLPHGDYVLEVRGRVGETLTSNSISYRFSVNKPWYLSAYAIAGYIAIAVLIGLTIHLLNRRYYRKQKDELLVEKERELELEQLENQRQLMAVKNENLQLDIDNKSRELGMATMNLVKKNELLNTIKVELIKSKSAEQVKQVIKMINVNMNDTSDWKRFEEAFNNVDKEFMKRIKELHPTITPNDLRLCTYLRLNLSSKEIAPLLNISHKSVEVKRYRLRKKMGLAHNVSLSNYIIEL